MWPWPVRWLHTSTQHLKPVAEAGKKETLQPLSPLIFSLHYYFSGRSSAERELNSTEILPQKGVTLLRLLTSWEIGRKEGRAFEESVSWC